MIRHMNRYFQWLLAFTLTLCISIPGLNTGMYTFTPADTGQTNRLFKEVVPERMFLYNIRDRCSNVPKIDAVLLLRMVNITTLQIEKKESEEGSPWIFTEHAVQFVR